jgi:hypothetical protein
MVEAVWVVSKARVEMSIALSKLYSAQRGCQEGGPGDVWGLIEIYEAVEIGVSGYPCSDGLGNAGSSLLLHRLDSLLLKLFFS